jgi:hypothetical protein
MQDDSVFADFDVDDDGSVFLLRISFDGYGCCSTMGKARPMNQTDSKRFVSLIERNSVTSVEFNNIVSKYFRENSDVIWKDALIEHGLLRSGTIAQSD